MKASKTHISLGDCCLAGVEYINHHLTPKITKQILLLEKFETRKQKRNIKRIYISNESYLQSSLLVMYFLVRMVTEPSTMVLATSLQKYTI